MQTTFKKVIISIVVALSLSTVLTLIFPRWFLQDDARWTYLGDTARVDISLIGSLKRGRVKTEGADIKATQPKWLSSDNFQGTSVEFPVSYLKKAYKIRITPQADEVGHDSAFVLTFRGADIRQRGRKMPAQVTFRNISLNGETSDLLQQKVWCELPFTLKCPLLGQEITLTFDVCKPLAVSDISITRIFVIFLAFLLPSLFFTPIKNAVDRVLAFINRKDIVQVIGDGYRHIDLVYRRSFWIIFGVLCLAFGFHTICFMWGNHDWSLLNTNQRWLERAWAGKYMMNSVKVPFSNGIYLPLIYDLIAFISLSFNAVLLCRYWRLEKRVIYYVLCGLVLTVQPFTLGMLYFVHMIPEVFIGVTCVLVALLLSEKIATGGGYIVERIILSVLSIILINFALAMYPVLINTIAVAFAGRMLVQSFDWDGSWQKLKFCLKLIVISVTNMMLGIFLYKFAVTFVFPMRSFYNTDTLPLNQVPERLGILAKQCFHQLYEYNMPFLSQWILWVFLGFTILLAFYICFTGNIKQKIVKLLILFCALFATQTAMIIAKTHLIDGRVELFGLVFFEVLVIAVLLTRIKKLHNVFVIAGACVIFASVLRDLDCLRVWKLGFDAEKMLWNRVLARLEIQKDFSPTKKYDIVQIGKPFSLRAHFYAGLMRKFHDNGYDLLNFSYDHCMSDNTFAAFEFYYPVKFRSSKRFSFYQKHNPEYIDRLRRLYQAGVLQKAEVWPKPNGLIVWKDIILFVTEGNELNDYRKRFKRELGKK